MKKKEKEKIETISMAEELVEDFDTPPASLHMEQFPELSIDELPLKKIQQEQQQEEQQEGVRSQYDVLKPHSLPVLDRSIEVDGVSKAAGEADFSEKKRRASTPHPPPPPPPVDGRSRNDAQARRAAARQSSPRQINPKDIFMQLDADMEAALGKSRADDAQFQAHEARLRRRVALYELEEVPGLDASGSCLFDAIADQLYRLRGDWPRLGDVRLSKEQVRERLVSWLRENADRGQYDFVQSVPNLNLDAYLRKMEKSWCYGDNLIIQVACELFRVNIVSITSLEGDDRCTFEHNHLPLGAVDRDEMPCLWLGNVFERHFWSLRQVSDLDGSGISSSGDYGGRDGGDGGDLALVAAEPAVESQVGEILLLEVVESEFAKKLNNFPGILIARNGLWEFKVKCPAALGEKVSFQLKKMSDEGTFEDVSLIDTEAIFGDVKKENGCMVCTIRATESGKRGPLNVSSLYRGRQKQRHDLFQIFATGSNGLDAKSLPLLIVGEKPYHGIEANWTQEFQDNVAKSFRILGFERSVVVEDDDNDAIQNTSNARKRDAEGLEREESSVEQKKRQKDEVMAEGVAVLSAALATFLASLLNQKVVSREDLESIIQKLNDYLERCYGGSESFKRVGDIAYWYRKLDSEELFHAGDVVALVILNDGDERMRSCESNLRVTSRPPANVRIFAWTVVADEHGTAGGPMPFLQKGDPDGLRGVAVDGAGGTGCVLVVFMGHVRVHAHVDVKAGDGLYGAGVDAPAESVRKASRSGPTRHECFGVAVSDYDPSDEAVMGLVWTLRHDGEAQELLSSVSGMVDERVLLRFGGFQEEMNSRMLSLESIQGALFDRVRAVEQKVSLLERYVSSFMTAVNKELDPRFLSASELEMIVRYCGEFCCDPATSNSTSSSSLELPWANGTNPYHLETETMSKLEECERALERLSRLETLVKNNVAVKVEKVLVQRAELALRGTRQILEEKAVYWTVCYLWESLVRTYSNFTATGYGLPPYHVHPKQSALSDSAVTKLRLVSGKEWKFASGSHIPLSKVTTVEEALSDRNVASSLTVLYAFPGGGSSTMLKLFCESWSRRFKVNASESERRQQQQQWPLVILLSADVFPSHQLMSLESVLARHWFDGNDTRAQLLLKWAGCLHNDRREAMNSILWLVDGYSHLCPTSDSPSDILSYGSVVVTAPLTNLGPPLRSSRELTVVAWNWYQMETFIDRYFGDCRGPRDALKRLIGKNRDLIQLFSRPALLDLLCYVTDQEEELKGADEERPNLPLLMGGGDCSSTGSTEEDMDEVRLAPTVHLLSVMRAIVTRTVTKLMKGDTKYENLDIRAVFRVLAERSILERVLDLSSASELEQIVVVKSGFFQAIGAPETGRHRWLHPIFRDFFLAERIFKGEYQPEHGLDHMQEGLYLWVGDFLGMMLCDRLSPTIDPVAQQVTKTMLRLNLSPVQDCVGCAFVRRAAQDVKLLSMFLRQGTPCFDQFVYRVGLLGDLEMIREFERDWEAFNYLEERFLSGVTEGGHVIVLDWLCRVRKVKGDYLLETGAYACNNQEVLEYIFNLPDVDPLHFFVFDEPKVGQLCFMQMVLERYRPSLQQIEDALHIWMDQVQYEDDETLAIRQLLQSAFSRAISESQEKNDE